MKVDPPRYFTSGSPKTCGNLVPLIRLVPGVGSRPPSVNVAPPSSEYMKPERLTGSSVKPSVSLKPMTMCWPVESTATEVSA